MVTHTQSLHAARAGFDLVLVAAKTETELRPHTHLVSVLPLTDYLEGTTMGLVKKG